MAKEASLSLLFLLSSLIICCSGALLGFSYHGTGDTASSASDGITFIQESTISQSQIRYLATDHKILRTLTNVSVDFFLEKSLVENLISSKSYEVSWVNAHLVSIIPQVDLRSIIISCGSECLGQKEMPLLLSSLKSIHSVLSKVQIASEVKVSVAFPLSFLENLNPLCENDFHRILWFIKKIDSFIIIEDNIDGKLSMGDHHFQSVIKRANLVASILPCKDVPVVLAIKSSVIPRSMELAQFSEAISNYFEAESHISKIIVAFYLEVSTTKDFVLEELKREEEDIFPFSSRAKLSKVNMRRTLQDTNNSPTPVFPTNPTSPTPVITPPDTPTIITVPSTNPVTVSPTNPAATPVTVPSTTPAPPLSPTNPTNSPAAPVTNPVTSPITFPGAQPVTNPVTSSYPPPSGSVPVTNPQSPPGNTNAPASAGQSWCVAKNGVPETTLQSALDYACGMGTADCSQIQQGGSCYNPNSIQNHASFAFNSYYQKNPAPTSCDFGGAATIVSTNPSTGTCIYPSSSGAGAGAGAASSGGAPTSAFGSQSSPDFNTSPSAGPIPYLSCMFLVISLVSGRLIMSL